MMTGAAAIKQAALETSRVMTVLPINNRQHVQSRPPHRSHWLNRPTNAKINSQEDEDSPTHRAQHGEEGLAHHKAAACV
jgi:hypothetical protein